MGIISSGFNTLELLTVNDRTVVQAMTAGRTLGVHRLLELLNGDNLHTLGELDTKLRSSKLEIRQAIPVWAREVTGQIEKTWAIAGAGFRNSSSWVGDPYYCVNCWSNVSAAKCTFQMIR